jgi:hypothetical protein
MCLTDVKWALATFKSAELDREVTLGAPEISVWAYVAVARLGRHKHCEKNTL